eukprot:UN05430
MAELSLMNVLDKMGVQWNNQDKNFASFKSTIQRRRLMKKQYEENMLKNTKAIIGKLARLSKREVPRENPEDEKVYNTLKDNR